MPEQKTEGVLKKSIRGGTWLTFGYVVQKCIGLVSFLILARLLTPAEFGIMAIILIVPKFLESVTDTGFGAALIQKAENIECYLNPTWTLRILKTMCLALLIAVFSPVIASFFHSEAALLAIRWSGIFIIIQSLSNIGETFFFKDLDFKKIFWRNIIREVAFVAAALLTVAFTKTYWVLFSANLAAYAAQALSTYFLSPYRPRFSFQFRPLWELVHYSKWIISQRWLVQVYNLIENVTVARLTPVSAVGLYSKAKSLSAILPVFVSGTLGMVSFPAYAKLQEEKEKIKDGFEKSLDILFFFTIPVMALVFACGGRLITIFLGGNWLPMLPVLELMTLFFTLSGINELAVSVFNATGAPKKQTYHGMVKFLATALTIIPLTATYGIVGTAISLLIGGVMLLILNLAGLKKMSLISTKALLNALVVPITLSVLLWVTVALSGKVVTALPTVPFIAVVGGSGITYLLLTYLAGQMLSYGPYKTIRMVVKSSLGK